MNAYKNKIRIQNAITYAIVIGCYILIQIMMAGGHVNSLLKGILVPLCTYTILAVSLNLTVGILGELSLGHAGFMCAGAFSGAFFNHAMKNLIASNQVRFILALFVGAAVAAVFGILIGIPVLRLKGDYLAIVTLAFGEIVKNIINVLYVGIDGNGIHVSMKDVASLKLAATKSLSSGKCCDIAPSLRGAERLMPTNIIISHIFAASSPNAKLQSCSRVPSSISPGVITTFFILSKRESTCKASIDPSGLAL